MAKDDLVKTDKGGDYVIKYYKSGRLGKGTPYKVYLNKQKPIKEGKTYKEFLEEGDKPLYKKTYNELTADDHLEIAIEHDKQAKDKGKHWFLHPKRLVGWDPKTHRLLSQRHAELYFIKKAEEHKQKK